MNAKAKTLFFFLAAAVSASALNSGTALARDRQMLNSALEQTFKEKDLAHREYRGNEIQAEIQKDVQSVAQNESIEIQIGDELGSSGVLRRIKRSKNEARLERAQASSDSGFFKTFDARDEQD